jgi:hypothetical protein
MDTGLLIFIVSGVIVVAVVIWLVTKAVNKGK